MDVMLQHHGAKRIYPIPEGLRELCTDISREVLRVQPANIYGFIAEYVETLLRSREHARIAARILSEILDETVSWESAWKRRGLTTDEVEHAAIIIQSAYRAYISRKRLRAWPSDLENLILRCGISIDTAQRAATVIQSAYRGHLAKRISLTHQQTCKLLQDLSIDASTAHRSAIVIQKWYRGHLARVYVKTHTVPESVTNIRAESRERINRYLIAMDITWTQANEAATKIQTAFKNKLVEEKAKSESLLTTRDLLASSSSTFKLTHVQATQMVRDLVSAIVDKTIGAGEADQVVEGIVTGLILKIEEIGLTKELGEEEESAEKEESKKEEEGLQVTKAIISSLVLEAVKMATGESLETKLKKKSKDSKKQRPAETESEESDMPPSDEVPSSTEPDESEPE